MRHVQATFAVCVRMIYLCKVDRPYDYTKEWHGMAQNGTLTPKQSALLLALVGGQRIEEAAKSVKVSRRTAYRWQKLESFQHELDQAREKAFERKLLMLKEGFGAALGTLLRNMSETAPPGVQVAAARCWIENTITIHKTEQLEAALEEMEATLKEFGGNYVSLQ
jgi:hypothetical protein